MEPIDSRTRRATLSAGLGLGAALAGCLGGAPSGGDDGPDESTEGEPTETTGAAGPEYTDNYSIDHPIAAGAENDPILGPPPDEAEMGIILVSEPSCPYCREFNDNVFEPLREEYIEPGRLSYVYRPYPKVREWGTTAAYAMLETWERDESAWLTLKQFYYHNAAEIGSVIDFEGRTAEFLNENTDVDGDAVAEAVDGFEQVDALTETADAVREADMKIIPNYAILHEGEVVTTTSGVQSYDNLKTMLEAD